jgi:hypothetical protein
MPSPGEDTQSWSTTASDNGNADPLINWLEGQARASVNNSARSMMAAAAKDRNLRNGSIVTGGITNVQTFSSGLVYTTVPSGLRATLKVGPSLTNTGAMTLNMDGIGAVVVKDQRGSDLSAGTWRADTYVNVLYDGTNWRLLDVGGGQTLVTQLLSTVINTSTGLIAFADFNNLDSTIYPRYQIVVSDFRPEIDDMGLTINFSNDNGATFPFTGTEYNGIETYGYQAEAMGGGEFARIYAQTDQGYLAVSWGVKASAFPSNIVIDLFGFEPAECPSVMWRNNLYDFEGTFATISNGTGYIITTVGCNAIRLWATGGNIKQATISLYGYKA